MIKYDVIVIGAGPAGLIAAGHAAELGAKVLLLEKMERVGRKLLITGKGRCNITNNGSMSEFFKQIYPNGRFLKHAFGEFFSTDIIELLNKQGVETVVERGERVFPVSNSAAVVVQALLAWVSKNKVDIHYGCKVDKLLANNQIIKGVVVTAQGVTKEIFADSVIVCTGGSSYPVTGCTGDGYRFAKALGHTIETVRPALVPLETAGNTAEQLQGLSLKNVNAVVWINGKKYKEEFGEMLFTHFGLTGPIILTLSRFVVDEIIKHNKVEISIDLKPALDDLKLDARLLRDLAEHGKKQMENLFKLWLPGKMVSFFINKLGLDAAKEGHQLNANERKRIRLLMKDFRFEVTGNRSFKEAIITAGGVSISEIDSKTMESKLVKGLFFAGEVLDLDANTGGFNLQIAYSTAWLAAKNCAKKVVV